MRIAVVDYKASERIGNPGWDKEFIRELAEEEGQDTTLFLPSSIGQDIPYSKRINFEEPDIFQISEEDTRLKAESRNLKKAGSLLSEDYQAIIILHPDWRTIVRLKELPIQQEKKVLLLFDGIRYSEEDVLFFSKEELDKRNICVYIATFMTESNHLLPSRKEFGLPMMYPKNIPSFTGRNHPALRIGIYGELEPFKQGFLESFLHHFSECSLQGETELDICVVPKTFRDEMFLKQMDKEYKKKPNISISAETLTREGFTKRMQDCDILAVPWMNDRWEFGISKMIVSAICYGKPIICNTASNYNVVTFFDNGLVWNPNKGSKKELEDFLNQFQKNRNAYMQKCYYARRYYLSHSDLAGEVAAFLRKEEPETSKPNLPYLEIHLTNKCNLNCKGCLHFSNLCEEKDLYMQTADDVEAELSELAKHTGISELKFLGGEPLLNPELSEILDVARKIFPQTSITLLTNGFMLPDMKEPFWDSMKRNKIHLTISYYKPLQNRLDRIRKAVFLHDMVASIWPRPMSAFYRQLAPEGKENPEKAHEGCQMKFCTSLYKGKIYRCPFEAYADILAGHFHCREIKETQKKMGFSIRVDGDEYWKEVIQAVKEAGEFCRFCTPEQELYEWGTADIHRAELDDWVNSGKGPMRD